jgi:hypothetical protein
MSTRHVAFAVAVIVVALAGGCGLKKAPPPASSSPMTPPLVKDWGTPAASARDITLACPVSGTKHKRLDMIPVKLNSQVYYVAAPASVQSLKQRPDKYAKALKAQRIALEQHPELKPGAETAFCPICGGEALKVDMVPLTLKGKTTYACCSMCVADLMKTPAPGAKAAGQPAPGGAKPRH